MKRLFDVFVAASTLLILSPILLTVAVVVRIGLGAPVFFSQLRPGRHGKPFLMRKFRTMTEARDPGGNLASDAERLTAIGRFLRSTSLDELPELWSVLTGDMSIVGPRPLLMEYLELYSSEQARRHHVRPGLTGWAQVNGRNNLGWEKRLALDVWYVDHWSWRLDLKILWMTVVNVVLRKGISAPNEATMPRFTGSAGRSRL
jgi:lipopolysaccharide/colanic/teichoic acid biosynthesis glycosyltransferase